MKCGSCLQRFLPRHFLPLEQVRYVLPPGSCHTHRPAHVPVSDERRAARAGTSSCTTPNPQMPQSSDQRWPGTSGHGINGRYNIVGASGMPNRLPSTPSLPACSPTQRHTATFKLTHHTQEDRNRTSQSIPAHGAISPAAPLLAHTASRPSHPPLTSLPSPHGNFHSYLHHVCFNWPTACSNCHFRPPA